MVNNRLKTAKCRDSEKSRSSITGLCMTSDELIEEDRKRTFQFFLPRYGIKGIGIYEDKKFLPEWVYNKKDIGKTRYLLSECLKNGVSLQLESKDGFPLWTREGQPRWKSFNKIENNCINNYKIPKKPTTTDSLFTIDYTKNLKTNVPYEWIESSYINLDNTTWSDNTDLNTFKKIFEKLEIIIKNEEYTYESITNNLNPFETVLFELSLGWLYIYNEEDFFTYIENQYKDIYLPPKQISVLYGWSEILTLYWNCSKPQKNKINNIVNELFQGDERPVSFIKNKLCPLKKKINSQFS
jgi:hypothetical protein